MFYWPGHILYAYTYAHTQPVQVVIDGTTGRLKAINNTESDIFVKVDQAFMWYPASVGDHASTQSSGAYIFR